MKPDNIKFVKVNVVAFVLLTLSVLLIPRYSPGVVNDSSVKAWDCQGCHGQERVLPEAHTETKGQNLSDCRECHNKPDSNLREKMTLSHIHNLAGISCAECHKSEKSAGPVSKDQCLDCHGPSQKVAELTAAKSHNPHNSPHYGPDVDCVLCHHLHQKSENLCNECHQFTFVVP